MCICPDLGKCYVSSQLPLCTPRLGKGVLSKLQSYQEQNKHGLDGVGESEKQRRVMKSQGCTHGIRFGFFCEAAALHHSNRVGTADPALVVEVSDHTPTNGATRQ